MLQEVSPTPPMDYLCYFQQVITVRSPSAQASFKSLSQDNLIYMKNLELLFLNGFSKDTLISTEIQIISASHHLIQTLQVNEKRNFKLQEME